MRLVEYLPAAGEDLIDAWIHVADDRGASAADAYIDKVRDLCELIATQPEMGLARPEVAIGVRSFPVDNYVIFYEDAESSLRILRVWHSSQDPKGIRVW